MATITANTFLDDGVARTAAEVWACNGGRLTIRTDTRWHVGAPAAMTGVLGSLTVSSTLGGGLTLDGTKVRWMAYTGGSGTVPAIGTNVTMAGVTSSYLLAVYATITSAPTAVGAAMPATGFLKFREVTGVFSAGALSGISATASGADTVGWIEVVFQDSTAITVPRLGSFDVLGSWFTLGTTTGANNQNLLVPTNGSTGGTTRTPGIWIDDAPINITGAVWSANKIIYTAPGHGLTRTRNGDQRKTVFIRDAVPSLYNFPNGITATVLTDNTFEITASNPGTYTSGGTVNGSTYYQAVPFAELNATNYGTDIRSKVVLLGQDSTITIGHNTSVAVGFVPPAGRIIRIPNVFGRTCASSARAVNVAPNATLGTRPDFTTTNAGAININNFTTDWYLAFSQPYSVSMENVATFDTVNVSECPTKLNLRNIGIAHSGATVTSFLVLTSCFAAGSITEVFGSIFTTGNTVASSATSCVGMVFTRCHFWMSSFTRSASAASCSLTLCTDMYFYEHYQTNSPFRVNTCKNVVINGMDHTECFVGASTTLGNYVCLLASGSDTVLIRNVTFGLFGLIVNVHPYLGILNSAQCKNVTLRECGTGSVNLNGGTANSPAAIFVSSGNNNNIRIQRCYLVPTRTAAIQTVNSDVNVKIENSSGDYVDVFLPAALSSLVKGLGATNTVSGQAAVYGFTFHDLFTSSTTGRMCLAFNESSALTIGEVTVESGTPKFTSSGNLVMATTGDSIVFEQSYFAIGHTAFANVAPTLTGTNVTFTSGAQWGNHQIFYQINTGSGYSAWKNFNAATLSTETITSAFGFKLKIRVTCTTGATSNLLTYLSAPTVTTLVDQTSNLYPLDPAAASLILTGLKPNSEIRVYRVSDFVEIAGIENSGTTFTYNYEHTGTDTNIFIVVHALSYINIRIEGLALTAAGLNIPIQQQVDRQFSNL